MLGKIFFTMNLLLFLCRYWFKIHLYTEPNTSVCRLHSAPGLLSPVSSSSYSSVVLLNQQHCCQVVMASDCWVSCHAPRHSWASISPSPRRIPWSPWRLPWQPRETGTGRGGRRSWCCWVTSCWRRSVEQKQGWGPGLQWETSQH